MKTLRKIWEKLGELVGRLVEALGGGRLEPALVPIPVRDRPSRS
ncbi:MAG: hypothetical protein SNJ60_00660 [Pseudanabaenaceae cyanobacterium]